MLLFVAGLAFGQDITGGTLDFESSAEVYGRLASKQRTFCHVQAEIDHAGRVMSAQVVDCMEGLEEPSLDVVQRFVFDAVRVDGVLALGWVDLTLMWQGGHPRSWVNLVAALPVDEVVPDIEVVSTGELSRTEMARIGGAECVYRVQVRDGLAQLLETERCPDHIADLAGLVLATSRFEAAEAVEARVAVVFVLDEQPEIRILTSRLPLVLSDEQEEQLSRPRVRSEKTRYPAFAARENIYGACPVVVEVRSNGQVGDTAARAECHEVFQRHARRLVEDRTYFPTGLEEPAWVEDEVEYCFPMVYSGTQVYTSCSVRSHLPRSHRE